MTHDTYKWNICADLKVIALLLGLQLGNIKFPCFLCEWDNRDKSQHYVKGICPTTKVLEPGQKNVKHHSLVELSRIYCHLFVSNEASIRTLLRLRIVIVQHFCTCAKTSPRKVMPRYEMVLSPV